MASAVTIIALAALPVIGMALLGWRLSKKLDAIAAARRSRELESVARAAEIETEREHV